MVSDKATRPARPNPDNVKNESSAYIPCALMQIITLLIVNTYRIFR